MAAALTVGVAVGHHWTSWAVRRGDELLGAGTWINPAAVDVDARRTPVPPPSAGDLAELVNTIRAACGGETPAVVGASRVVLPQPTAQRGRISKRALHVLPATAAIAGAVAGAWPGRVAELDTPDSPAPTAELPAALKTPSRKGKTGSRSVTGGYRGGLAEARSAWVLAGLASSVGDREDMSTQGVPVAPDNPTPTRIDPAAFRRGPDGTRTSPAVQGIRLPQDDPAAEYSTELLAAIQAARPTTPAALAVAAADALALVDAPDGITAPTPGQLAAFAGRMPGVLPADYLPAL